MNYPIVFEEGPDGVSAFLPDLPGVGVVGADKFEAIAMIDKALQWHVEALLKNGQPLPQPAANQMSEWSATPDAFYVVADPAVLAHITCSNTTSTFYPVQAHAVAYKLGKEHGAVPNLEAELQVA